MMFFPSNPPENPGPSVPWPLCRYYWAVTLHGALQRARKRRVPSNAPCPSAASQWLHRWHTPRQRPSHPRFHLKNWPIDPLEVKLTIENNSLLEVLIVYKSLPKKMIFLEKPLNGMVFGLPGLIHFGLKSATSTNCNKGGEKTDVLDPPAAIAAMPGASGGHLELNVAWKVSQGKNGTPGTKRRWAPWHCSVGTGSLKELEQLSEFMTLKTIAKQIFTLRPQNVTSHPTCPRFFTTPTKAQFFWLIPLVLKVAAIEDASRESNGVSTLLEVEISNF